MDLISEPRSFYNVCTGFSEKTRTNITIVNRFVHNVFSNMIPSRSYTSFYMLRKFKL